MGIKVVIKALVVLALFLVALCTGAMWIEGVDTGLSNLILGLSLVGLLGLVVAINKEEA